MSVENKKFQIHMQPEYEFFNSMPEIDGPILESFLFQDEATSHFSNKTCDEDKVESCSRKVSLILQTHLERETLE